MPFEAQASEPDARAQARSWLGLELPDECVAGVTKALTALAEHGAMLRKALEAGDRPPA